ncbi:hypothetical protein [Halopseudomonas pelagia]|uniref:Uncharacterized protein n=1 Tax=Halopseudomonas pelagia TaxID=553151 RepID=A0AA91TYE7_9GAMM|nr:hypothetical protein [Halopseudomonas pelagia]PCC97328.1 hypothetical protein CO192_21395 [Halopseudomonas pelagia]QFY58514.1 hypothetical protein EAO82_20445 [Halopseudomonas pelagia]
MSSLTEIIAMKIPVTAVSNPNGCKPGFVSCYDMRQILNDAASYFKLGDALAAVGILEDVLWSPKASKLSIVHWLRLPIYLQHAGSNEMAWQVLEIYRYRRKDWGSQKEIARTMKIMAENEKWAEGFYVALIWFICCEDRERASQIKATRSSLGMSAQDLKQFTKTLAEKNGTLSKIRNNSDDGFYALKKTVWQHICSLNPKRLQTRLQNYAHRQDMPFPKQLTEALIQYRLTEKEYRYDSIVALVRSQNLGD